MLDHVGDAHLGHHRAGSLVDASVHSHVGVIIQDPRHHELPLGIDDSDPLGCLKVSADLCDLSVPDQDVCVRQVAIGDGENGSAPDEEILGGQRLEEAG